MDIKKFYEAPNQSDIVDSAVQRAIGSKKIDILKNSVDEIIYKSEELCHKEFLIKERKYGKVALKKYFEKTDSNERISSRINIDTISDNFDSLKKFFMSLSQARRSRAGKSFEIIIRNILKSCNINFSFQPSNIDGRPDFVIPGENEYHKNPQETIVLTAKRTVRERWRQITTEGTRGHRFYLATLDDKISGKTLDEMSQKHITLLIPKPIINKKPIYQKHSIVYPFYELFNRIIPNSVEFWNKN